MSHQWVRTPVEQFQPFKRGVDIPTPIDQVVDGHIVQTHVKIDSSYERQWPSKQHPGEDIRAHVEPAVYIRTTGNSLLAAGLRSHVPVARPSLTQRHHQVRLLWCRERVDWRVEWRSVVFSDENRFCLYVSDDNNNNDLFKAYFTLRRPLGDLLGLLQEYLPSLTTFSILC